MVSPIFRASIIVLALLAWSGTASATTIFFSVDTSADGDPPVPPADVLDATITFSFDASTNKLTIDFANLSDGILTELYFNTSSNVDGLFIIDPNDLTGASIGTWGAPPGTVDGFGDYGWLLDLGAGGSGGISADGTGQITFQVTPVLDEFGDPVVLSLSDFFVLIGGDNPNLGPAVLHFQDLDDSNFDSAFGLGSFTGGSGGGEPVPVPEPATLGLLFMGIVGIAATRLRRHTT